MSWSVNVIGRPEKIKEHLAAESTRLTGQSKAEFDEAMQHLCSLVDQNVSEFGVVQLEANGHAYFSGDTKTSSTCNVSIKSCSLKLV